MEEIVAFQVFLPSENYTRWSDSMVFGFEKIMDFAMDIVKLNLANLVGYVMEEITEYQIFFPKCTEIYVETRDFQKITKRLPNTIFQGKNWKTSLSFTIPYQTFLPINVKMSKIQSKFSDIMM